MKITRKKLVQLIKESIDKSVVNDLESLFKKLVPSSGKADTVEGEMVRAIMRVWYRYENDGDFFWRGYGKETALGSVKYLTSPDMPREIRTQLVGIFNEMKRETIPLLKTADKWGGFKEQFDENDPYLIGLNDAAKVIVQYVKRKGNNLTSNDKDSR